MFQIASYGVIRLLILLLTITFRCSGASYMTPMYRSPVYTSGHYNPFAAASETAPVVLPPGAAVTVLMPGQEAASVTQDDTPQGQSPSPLNEAQTLSTGVSQAMPVSDEENTLVQPQQVPLGVSQQTLPGAAGHNVMPTAQNIPETPQQNPQQIAQQAAALNNGGVVGNPSQQTVPASNPTAAIPSQGVQTVAPVGAMSQPLAPGGTSIMRQQSPGSAQVQQVVQPVVNYANIAQTPGQYIHSTAKSVQLMPTTAAKPVNRMSAVNPVVRYYPSVYQLGNYRYVQG